MSGVARCKQAWLVLLVAMLWGGPATAYNRTAAVGYANTWCGGKRNTAQYCDYTGKGGDCTNFVSQCLLAGGVKLKGTGCGGTFTGGGELSDALRAAGWKSTYGYKVGPPANIRPGDVIQFYGGCKNYVPGSTSNCNKGHTVFVQSGSGPGAVACASHTSDRCNASWTTWVSSMPYVEWLHYPDDNRPPTGHLDGAAADCSHVGGWAQDPDTPTKALNVHVYFNAPAGTSGAIGLPAGLANIHRSDLCKALGSCNHAFALTIPPALRESKPHKVWAYTFDSKTKKPVMLKSCPRSFTCKPPTPSLKPARGFKRWITSTTSLAAWKLTSLDVATLPDATVAAFPLGLAAPAQPALVQADDGTPEVWLLDSGVRRHVKSQTSYLAWRFNLLGKVAKWPAATVYGYTKGVDWPAAPFVMKRSGGAVYLLDSWNGKSVGPGGDGSAGPDGGDATGRQADATAAPGRDLGAMETGPAVAPREPGSLEGEGCSLGRGGATGGGEALVLLVVLLLLALHRRTAKPKIRVE